MTEEELMLTTVLNCPRIDLYLEKNVLTESQKLVDEMKQRRGSGEPVQYILGQSDFMGVKLYVDKRVLIPRPETEILVEKALEELTDLLPEREIKILDVGTGSGNIAITLAKNLMNCRIMAIDVSRDALNVARYNAHFNKVDSNITFVASDMTKFLKDQIKSKNRFDLIVSNPPYIPKNYMSHLPLEVQREPQVALDGGEDGLVFVREIFGLASNLLTDQGCVMCEIWDGQKESVEGMIRSLNVYSEVTFYKDYTDSERIVVARK